MIWFLVWAVCFLWAIVGVALSAVYKDWVTSGSTKNMVLRYCLLTGPVGVLVVFLSWVAGDFKGRGWP